jgi:hypothetical protein
MGGSSTHPMISPAFMSLVMTIKSLTMTYRHPSGNCSPRLIKPFLPEEGAAPSCLGSSQRQKLLDTVTPESSLHDGCLCFRRPH